MMAALKRLVGWDHVCSLRDEQKRTTESLRQSVTHNVRENEFAADVLKLMVNESAALSKANYATRKPIRDLLNRMAEVQAEGKQREEH